MKGAVELYIYIYIYIYICIYIYIYIYIYVRIVHSKREEIKNLEKWRLGVAVLCSIRDKKDLISVMIVAITINVLLTGSVEADTDKMMA